MKISEFVTMFSWLTKFKILDSDGSVLYDRVTKSAICAEIPNKELYYATDTSEGILLFVK